MEFQLLDIFFVRLQVKLFVSEGQVQAEIAVHTIQFYEIQLQDTLKGSDMLEYYICLYQTKLEVLPQKELTVLQKNYG